MSQSVQDLRKNFEPSRGKKKSQSVQDLRMNFEPASFTLKGEQFFRQGRQVHSHEGDQEHYSKLTKGEEDPESLQRGGKKMSQSVQDLRKNFESSSASSAAPQLAVPGGRKVTPHAGGKKMSQSVQDLRMNLEPASSTFKRQDSALKRGRLEVRGRRYVSCPVDVIGERGLESQGRERIVELNTTRAPESMQKDVERPSFVKTVEQMEKKPGRTMERNTTRALESLQEEEERILSEKPAVLQSQLEVAQHAAPPLEELTNIQTSLQTISEKLHTLQVSLQNLEASREQDLQVLREEMECRITKNLEAPKESLQKTEERLMEVENKLGRIMEFFREEMEGIITKDLEEAKKSWTTEMEAKLELFHVQQYKVDVTLDADTAHPRLKVSKDGKSVTDTGKIRKVSSKEERFDSHAFVLAKEGYTSGRLYWEVDVGKRRNWILGVAQKTVKRKGEVVLSPQNGFWAIGVADEQDYWAYTDPWTRLTVSGRPQKIGIFLDISGKNLSFYSVHQKKAFYTFTFESDHRQKVKLVPFFSTGSTAIKDDTEPLQIV